MEQVNYEELDTDEITNTIIRARQYAILMNACIFIPILIIIILIIEWSKRNGHECGIPVKLWVELMFIIPLVYSILLLNELWILRCNRNAVIPHALILGLLLLLVYAAVFIWGYIIYFDDANNCQDYSDTSVFLVFMIIFLFFGLFILLILCLLLICGPIAYCYYRDAMRRPGKLEDQGQIASVIGKLQRTQFDPRTMTAETTCTICYEDFQPGDKVTQLKCNEAHLFHTDCIIKWI